MSSGNQHNFQNARSVSLGHASFSNIGRDQVNNDHRVELLNNNPGGGTQHNYNGTGLFINHGRSQNINLGMGNLKVYEHSVLNTDDQSSPINLGGNQGFRRHEKNRKHPFQHNRRAACRSRPDSDILDSGVDRDSSERHKSTWSPRK
ncbi:hypothetical protein L218DRAFT_989657 [Marasmius fiardii PR-910]|nr:hypothetical protein L218DRAFT_989657 [Marasmius fiardii PR-910]